MICAKTKCSGITEEFCNKRKSLKMANGSSKYPVCYQCSSSDAPLKFGKIIKRKFTIQDIQALNVPTIRRGLYRTHLDYQAKQYITDRTLQLQRKGLNLLQISEILNVSHGTIRKLLKERRKNGHS